MHIVSLRSLCPQTLAWKVSGLLMSSTITLPLYPLCFFRFAGKKGFRSNCARGLSAFNKRMTGPPWAPTRYALIATSFHWMNETCFWITYFSFTSWLLRVWGCCSKMSCLPDTSPILAFRESLARFEVGTCAPWPSETSFVSNTLIAYMGQMANKKVSLDISLQWSRCEKGRMVEALTQSVWIIATSRPACLTKKTYHFNLVELG